eukprot:scaffold65261_cov35-Tisochrysis_lutea.AAC.2
MAWMPPSILDGSGIGPVQPPFAPLPTRGGPRSGRLDGVWAHRRSQRHSCGGGVSPTARDGREVGARWPRQSSVPFPRSSSDVPPLIAQGRFDCAGLPKTFGP